MNARFFRQSDFITEIIRAYDKAIVKAYCTVRFNILHQRFLNEIGQYLKYCSYVIDIGCGFGLFSLYYAQRFPKLNIFGIDNNPARVQMARRAADRLLLSNVTYEVGDAASYNFNFSFDGVYMFDMIHHIQPQAVAPLLNQIHSRMNDGGRLIIKDIDTKPSYKLLFTYIIDRMLAFRCEVHYWDNVKLSQLLSDTGYQVYQHTMVDILPYSHILYICKKVTAIECSAPAQTRHRHQLGG